jgi:plasmid stabilization system protein ParE
VFGPLLAGAPRAHADALTQTRFTAENEREGARARPSRARTVVVALRRAVGRALRPGHTGGSHHETHPSSIGVIRRHASASWMSHP